MSTDLDDLLGGAVARDDSGLPDAATTWEAGLRRRRRTRALTAGAGALATAAVVGLATLALDAGPTPAPLIDDPTPAVSPDPAPRPTPSPTSDPSPAPPPDDTAPQSPDLAVTVTNADGTRLTRGDGDEIALPPDATVAYPQRLRALAGGALAWQADDGTVWVLRPDEQAPVVLLDPPTDAATRVQLTGTGIIDGRSVVLVERGRAASLVDDDGGAAVAVALDGTETVLATYEGAWEYSLHVLSLLDGWSLQAEGASVEQRLDLVAPDGTTTEVDASSDADGTGPLVRDAVLVPGRDAGVPMLVTLRNEPRDGVEFGRTVLEGRDVTAGADDLVFRTEVPALDGWGPKQLQVRGGSAWLTLLQDAERLVRVDLLTGEVEEFEAPGIAAVVPDAPGHHDAVAAPFVTSPITFEGWGPLRLGMTQDEVETTLGTYATGECGGSTGPPFLNVHTGYDPDGRLVRVDAYRTWPHRGGVTPAPFAGVGFGTGEEAAVAALQGAGLDVVVEEVPDLLADLDGLEDNTERRIAARQDGLLLAWTLDDDGVVQQVRVGEAEAAEFMSICA